MSSGEKAGDLNAVLKVKEDPEVTAAAEDAMAAVQKQQDEVWQKTSTGDKVLCAGTTALNGYLAATSKHPLAVGFWAATTTAVTLSCMDSAADLAGFAGEKKGPIARMLTPEKLNSK